MRRRDQDRFEQRVLELKMYVGALFGKVDATFPAGRPQGLDAGPESCEEPLRTIAGGIDDVLASFDSLQVAMGQEPAHTRHARFLSGGCHER